MNFPSNPLINDVYSLGSRSWQWNGVAWIARATPNSNLTTIAAATPADGDVLEYLGAGSAWVATLAPRKLKVDGGNF